MFAVEELLGIVNVGHMCSLEMFRFEIKHWKNGLLIFPFPKLVWVTNYGDISRFTL
jgi:hypothetical protein